MILSLNLTPLIVIILSKLITVFLHKNRLCDKVFFIVKCVSKHEGSDSQCYRRLAPTWNEVSNSLRLQLPQRGGINPSAWFCLEMLTSSLLHFLWEVFLTCLLGIILPTVFSNLALCFKLLTSCSYHLTVYSSCWTPLSATTAWQILHFAILCLLLSQLLTSLSTLPSNVTLCLCLMFQNIGIKSKWFTADHPGNSSYFNCIKPTHLLLNFHLEQKPLIYLQEVHSWLWYHLKSFC